MATTNENVILVQMDGSIAIKPTIVRVIRTYLSQRRAEEDMELLREINPDKSYAIQTVAFIDN